MAAGVGATGFWTPCPETANAAASAPVRTSDEAQQRRAAGLIRRRLSLCAEPALFAQADDLALDPLECRGDVACRRCVEVTAVELRAVEVGRALVVGDALEDLLRHLRHRAEAIPQQ